GPGHHPGRRRRRLPVRRAADDRRARHLPALLPGPPARPADVVVPCRAPARLAGRRRDDPRPPGAVDPPRDWSVMDLDRTRYAALLGPTTGDRTRLARPDLLVEVPADRARG